MHNAGGLECLHCQSTGGEQQMNKQWVAIAFAVASAIGAGNAMAAGGDGRPAVGVAEFRNETGASWWRGGVGWELSGMLSNELSSSGDFRVVERNKLQNVLEEQNLAASGRVAPSTGAKIGKLTRSEEHTSELQSQFHLVCRLLLE